MTYVLIPYYHIQSCYGKLIPFLIEGILVAMINQQCTPGVSAPITYCSHYRTLTVSNALFNINQVISSGR